MARSLKRTSEYKKIIAEMPENPKVKSEFDRMLPRFESLDDGKAVIAMKLLARVAFMTVQLSEIERHIAKDGVREVYQNGANQSGYKKSTHVEVYIAMMKNYAGVTKQLNDMVSAGGEPEKNDGFEEFTSRKE